jgi:hypothetical protein
MPQAQISDVDVNLYQHVRVLLGILLGLSVTRLIGGLATLIQDRAHHVSLIHLGWVGWALMNVFAFWWWEFRLWMVVHWDIGIYLFMCLYASTFYFLSALLLPKSIEGYNGYQDYFLTQRIWFFGAVALNRALDVVDTRIKGAEHLTWLGTEYLVRFGAFIVLCAIAARTRNLRFHAIFVIIGLMYEASFFVRSFYEIS